MDDTTLFSCTIDSTPICRGIGQIKKVARHMPCTRSIWVSMSAKAWISPLRIELLCRPSYYPEDKAMTLATAIVFTITFGKQLVSDRYGRRSKRFVQLLALVIMATLSTQVVHSSLVPPTAVLVAWLNRRHTYGAVLYARHNVAIR